MINILMCGNDKVFDGMMIAFLSLVKHNKEEINAYLLTMDLQSINEKFKPITDTQSSYLEDILKLGNEKSRVHLVDMTDNFLREMSNSVNLGNSYTPYTLLRLFADMIENVPDKLLYLDTDIVINGDISALYETDVTGYEFAGCYDALGRFFIKYNYMNAGVLVFNMLEMKKTDLFFRARHLCVHKKMAFSDQSALNKLVKKKKFVSSKYNKQRGKVKKDTVIRHFCKTIKWLPFFHTINIKPWHVDRLHKILKIHDFDDILQEYQLRSKL